MATDAEIKALAAAIIRYQAWRENMQRLAEEKKFKRRAKKVEAPSPEPQPDPDKLVLS